MILMSEAVKQVFSTLSICARMYMLGMIAVMEEAAERAAGIDGRKKESGASWVRIEDLKARDPNVFAVLVRNLVGDRSTYKENAFPPYAYHYQEYLQLTVYYHGEIIANWRPDKQTTHGIVQVSIKDAVLGRVVAKVKLSHKDGSTEKLESSETTVSHEKRWKRARFQQYSPWEALIRSFRTISTFSGGGKRGEGCEWHQGDVVYSYSERDAARKVLSCAIQMAKPVSRADAKLLFNLLISFQYPNLAKRTSDEDRFILEEMDLIYEAHKVFLKRWGFSLDT